MRLITYFCTVFPGWGLCTKIGAALRCVKIAREPDVLPFSSNIYPNLHSNVTNSSNVKSEGIFLNRSINLSFVLMSKCN